MAKKNEAKTVEKEVVENVEMLLNTKKVSVVVDSTENISKKRKFDSSLLESLKLNGQLTPVQVYKSKGE
jgi:hypothetical protein